jgi:hypothetical protein
VEGGLVWNKRGTENMYKDDEATDAGSQILGNKMSYLHRRYSDFGPKQAPVGGSDGTSDGTFPVGSGPPIKNQ